MFTESAEWIGAILMSFLRKYGDQKAAAPVTSDGRPVNFRFSALLTRNGIK